MPAVMGLVRRFISSGRGMGAAGRPRPAAGQARPRTGGTMSSSHRQDAMIGRTVRRMFKRVR